jgi:hypothetical protein
MWRSIGDDVAERREYRNGISQCLLLRDFLMQTSNMSISAKRKVNYIYLQKPTSFFTRLLRLETDVRVLLQDKHSLQSFVCRVGDDLVC